MFLNIAYERKGEIDPAINDYSKVIKLTHGSSFSYSDRARAYRKKGETDLAIKDYKTAIDLNPQYVNNYYDLVIIRLQQQDWKNAKADLMDAQNRDIDIINLFFRYHRTIVELEEGIEVKLPKDIATMLVKSPE